MRGFEEWKTRWLFQRQGQIWGRQKVKVIFSPWVTLVSLWRDFHLEPVADSQRQSASLEVESEGGAWILDGQTYWLYFPRRSQWSQAVIFILLPMSHPSLITLFLPSLLCGEPVTRGRESSSLLPTQSCHPLFLLACLRLPPLQSDPCPLHPKQNLDVT